jgi:cation transport regulator ChaC
VFAERCTALLDEIAKETKAEKYTFAEMEENGQDLEKLVRWLAKIQARDFFPDQRLQQAAAMLARCRSAAEPFSQSVYTAERATVSGSPDPQVPADADPGNWTGLPTAPRRDGSR